MVHGFVDQDGVIQIDGEQVVVGVGIGTVGVMLVRAGERGIHFSAVKRKLLAEFAALFRQIADDIQIASCLKTRKIAHGVLGHGHDVVAVRHG